MAVGTVNNPTAFSVYSNYSSSSTSLQKSMSRLSSGVKSVVDDGAGVGISERMRSQADSTSMARNNVENAISVLQTADGWMQEVNDTLSRMHELAIESNDATKTDTDRTNINAEFGQLQEEITRIVSTAAKFNGKNLLDGTMNTATQVGADSGQTITLKVDSLASVTQMISNASGGVATASAAVDQISKLQTQIDNVSKARASVGGLQSRFEHTRSGLLTYEDNIRAAESKVRDVDMARESSEMTKSQILTQVGNSMLAQANQLPQSVLKLLG
jgi:flagellin